MDREETLDQRQILIAAEDSGNASNDAVIENRLLVENASEKANVIATNIIQGDHGPIVGYASEPLLPLAEACAPLTNIIDNLSFYIQMALDETPKAPSDGLTIDESAAIRLYTIKWEEPQRSLHFMLNQTLKSDDRENLRPYFKYLKLFLTALIKLPCVPPMTIWRGVTKDLSAEYTLDTQITWWGFSSCTTELTVLENNMYLGNSGKRTLFSVETINSRLIRNHAHIPADDEILLLPGTRMIVQIQLCPAPDLHIIHLKQIIPEEMLLEPPFEGISKIFNNFSKISYNFYI
jgi:hypothetical protein